MIGKSKLPFNIKLVIIDKGYGEFQGAFEDINLSEGSSLTWVSPRRILKVPPDLPLKGGMVIQSPLGVKYMVSNFGPSETSMGVAFRAFRLYQANVVMQWQTRVMGIDARTGLAKEGVLSDPVDIYAQVEPQQEAFDRQIRIPNEKLRIVTNEPVQRDDVINGNTVIEVHPFQGLYGVILA